MAGSGATSQTKALFASASGATGITIPISRRGEVNAVYVVRWRWDGARRIREASPESPLEPAPSGWVPGMRRWWPPWAALVPPPGCSWSSSAKPAPTSTGPAGPMPWPAAWTPGPGAWTPPRLPRMRVCPVPLCPESRWWPRWMRACTRNSSFTQDRAKLGNRGAFAPQRNPHFGPGAFFVGGRCGSGTSTSHLNGEREALGAPALAFQAASTGGGKEQGSL